MNFLKAMLLGAVLLAPAYAVETDAADAPEVVTQHKNFLAEGIFVEIGSKPYDSVSTELLTKVKTTTCSSYKEVFDLFKKALNELGGFNSGVALSELTQYGRSFFGKETKALEEIKLFSRSCEQFSLLEVGPGKGLSTLELISALEEDGYFKKSSKKIIIRLVEINPDNLPALQSVAAIIQGAFPEQVFVDEEMRGDITKIETIEGIREKFDVISFLNVYHYLSTEQQRKAFLTMDTLIKPQGLLVGSVHTQEDDQDRCLQVRFKNGGYHTIKYSAQFVTNNELRPGQFFTMEEFNGMKKPQDMLSEYDTILKHYASQDGFAPRHIEVSAWSFVRTNEQPIEKGPEKRLKSSS